MSEFNLSIPESYERLVSTNIAYYVKTAPGAYNFLPEPETAEWVHKAKIEYIPRDFSSGVNIHDFPEIGDPDNIVSDGFFKVSPRELFLATEMFQLISTRTDLPVPLRPVSLDKKLNTKTSNFRKKLAPAMARVVIERFAEDRRDSSGRVRRR
jgi:hypothetical protein